MQRLIDYVRKMPQPGSGSCNRYLLGAANVGILCGLTDIEILRTILANLRDPGPNTDRAIIRAIKRARIDCGHKQSPTNFPLYSQENPTKCPGFTQWLSRSPMTIDEAIESSPIKLSGRLMVDAMLMLDVLFKPTDILFIGDKFSRAVRPVEYWVGNPDVWGEFIIPNPLDGKEHPTQTGRLSSRCDDAVQVWRYAVAEFDNLPIEKQISVWLTIDLPVAALIYSGGKSVHAWIYVNADRKDFGLVKKIYQDVIIPIGGDPACRNPSRLSRMPGVYRQDKEADQQLIWLTDPKQLEVQYGPKDDNRSGGEAEKEGQ